MTFIRSEENKTDWFPVCLCSLFSLPSSVKSCLLHFSLAGVSCLSASPLSCSLTFSLSCPLSRLLSVSVSASHRGRQPRGTRGPTGGSLWHSPYLWSWKTKSSHFLLFYLKWATGVAYLPSTEILAVGRQGVALITSSAIISFRLMNLKQCHLSISGISAAIGTTTI